MRFTLVTVVQDGSDGETLQSLTEGSLVKLFKVDLLQATLSVAGNTIVSNRNTGDITPLEAAGAG